MTIKRKKASARELVISLWLVKGIANMQMKEKA